MRKIIISGGPSTGKSTTFELLQQRYTDAHFVPEAAEQVIKRELAKQSADPTYTPVMPVENYRKFVPLVLEQQLSDEARIPSDADTVFMDRSIIDNLGYLAHNGISDFTDRVQDHARAAGYTIAFFCDWLGKFERTEIRRETAEAGLEIHEHLETAYHASDIPVVHLPAVSIEERLTIIRDTILEL